MQYNITTKPAIGINNTILIKPATPKENPMSTNLLIVRGCITLASTHIAINANAITANAVSNEGSTEVM